MPVPYTFGTATASIPLSQLDSNFATAITIGNTAVQLGNTVTTLNNMTLANVTISSGNVTITNVSVTTANVSGTANVSTMVIIGNESVGGNTTVTGNISANNATLTTNLTLSGGTANGVAYLNGSKALTTGSTLTFDGTNFVLTGSSRVTQWLDGAYLQMQNAGATANWITQTSGLNLSVTSAQNGAAIWSINGSEQMRLTSTGLGIGTSSPTDRLDVRFASGTGNLKAGVVSGNNIKIFNTVGDLAVSSSDATSDVYLDSQRNVFFKTSSTERMRIDSSGNVGIGVTPSAWGSAYKMFQASSQASFGGNSSNITIVGSNYYNDGASKYIGTGLAALYLQDAGVHKWLNAPSGTAGTAITFTQAMTLDASGNLGIGTTSPISKLNISTSTGTVANNAFVISNTNVGGTGGEIQWYSRTNDGTNTDKKAAVITVTNSLDWGSAAGVSSYMAFSTINANTFAERMRIDSVGNMQMQAGAVMPYAPAPASISTTATLTNANIQAQIINTTGTTYTVTMPLGTTLETLATWATTNVAYDFFVINTATGIITMAVNTGVTSLGLLTIAAATSAHFRIRRTAANTFVLYRLV